ARRRMDRCGKELTARNARSEQRSQRRRTFDGRGTGCSASCGVPGYPGSDSYRALSGHASAAPHRRRNALALGRTGRGTKREESTLDSRSYRAREKPRLWRSDGKGSSRAVESDESREEGSSRGNCSDFSGAVARRPTHLPRCCGIRAQRARSEGEKNRLDRRRGTYHHRRLRPRARIQRSREVAAGTRQPWDDSRRQIAERLSNDSKLEAILYEFGNCVDRSLA